MFTGWFYVCAGEVISWFLIWEQGVESSNLSVPTSKTPVQRLILEINKSRFWGFIRLRARLGRVSNWFNPQPVNRAVGCDFTSFRLFSSLVLERKSGSLPDRGSRQDQ